MKEEEREAWKAIEEGISTIEENGNWIKEERRIEKKKENSEETRMTTDRLSEARGGDLPEASRRELWSSQPSRPRSTPSSTPWPDSSDSVSELEFQVGGRDTRPEERGTGSPLSQTIWCSTKLTEGRGSSSSPDSVGASQGQVRGKSGAGTQDQRGGGQAHHRVRLLGVLPH